MHARFNTNIWFNFPSINEFNIQERENVAAAATAALCLHTRIGCMKLVPRYRNQTGLSFYS
jgi:hypothetical protein